MVVQYQVTLATRTVAPCCKHGCLRDGTDSVHYTTLYNCRKTPLCRTHTTRTLSEDTVPFEGRLDCIGPQGSTYRHVVID